MADANQPPRLLQRWLERTLRLYAAVMMGVCMLACIMPTLRALRIQPTEALKYDT